MKNLKKVLFSLLFVGIAGLLLSAFNTEKGKPAPFRVVGYLYNKKMPLDKVPYQYLTVINYSFAVPAPDSSGNIVPLQHPARLKKLANMAHNRGVKVFISVGGWNIGDGGGNDTRFEVLANSAVTRTNFTESAMKLVRKFNLDGIDIDWEYPNPYEPSSTNYVLLMKQLSDSLHTAGKKLSAAIVSNKDYYGYGIKKEAFPYVDWMNIMSYDYKDNENYPHSPYWLAVRSFDYWVKDRNLPKSKAVLGLNFAAYRFLLRMGANPRYDSFVTNKSPFGFKKPVKPNINVVDTLYYNGITTVKEKTKLAMKRGSGIMIWAVMGDTTGKFSLLKAIHEVVESK
jgi:GH18 family chitinase